MSADNRRGRMEVHSGGVAKKPVDAARTTCPDCGGEVPNDVWSCPACGEPVEATAAAETGKEISSRGMKVVVTLFILVPILLFLLHIFVPSL